MNCKQGDLAIYAGYQPQLLGRIVKCVAPHINIYEPAWQVDPPLYDCDPIWDPRLVADSVLIPIRPQRDDAVDEMIALLGAPRKEGASA